MRRASLAALAGLLFPSSCANPALEHAALFAAPADYESHYSYSLALDRVDAQGWLDSDPSPEGRLESDSSRLEGSLSIGFEERGDALAGSEGPSLTSSSFSQSWSDSREGVVISAGAVSGTCALSRSVDAGPGVASDSARAPGAAAVLFEGESGDAPEWELTPSAAAFLLAPLGELELTDAATGQPCVDLLATLRSSTRTTLAATRRPNGEAGYEVFDVAGTLEGRVENEHEDRPGAKQEDSMRAELRGVLRRSRTDPRCASAELTGELVLDVKTTGPIVGPDGREDRLHVLVRSRGELRLFFETSRR